MRPALTGLTLLASFDETKPMKYSLRSMLGLVVVIVSVLCVGVERIRSSRNLRSEVARAKIESRVARSANEGLLFFNLVQQASPDELDRLLRKELLYRMKDLYLQQSAFLDLDDARSLAQQIATTLQVSSVNDFEECVQNCFLEDSVELYWMGPHDEQGFEIGFRMFVDEVCGERKRVESKLGE